MGAAANMSAQSAFVVVGPDRTRDSGVSSSASFNSGFLRWRVRLCVVVALLAGPALAMAQAAAPAASSPAGGVEAATPAPGGDSAQSVELNHRPIVTFQAPFLGRSPRQRARLAAMTLEGALQRGGPGQVSVWIDADTAGLKVEVSC